MKILLSLTSVFFLVFSLHAQNTGGAALEAAGAGGINGLVGGTATNAFQTMHAESVFKARGGDRLSYGTVKGSPFLNKEAVKGTLVLHDGNMLKDVLLQFDLYTNDIIATLEDGEEVFIDKIYYKEIIIPTDGKDAVLRRLDPEKPDILYEVLYQDEDMAFFKQRTVTLREGSNSGLAKVKPRFDKRTTYFIKQGKQKVEKVKLKEKDVLSKFKKREANTLKSYAKKNGIKLKKEKDFITLFTGVYSDAEVKE